MNLTSSHPRPPTAPRSAGEGMIKWARLGYAAKGVVYLIIGLLAVLWASGQRSEAPDRQTAIQSIHDQPFGQALLVLVALGLLGYAIWRLVGAIVDVEDQGTKPQGIATRIGYGVVAVSYGLLAVTALQIALGLGNSGQGSGSDASTQDWTARLLSQPFGVALVVLIGLIIIGAGVYHLYLAWSTKFEEKLDLHGLDQKGRELCTRIGQIGLAAQGVVMGTMGVFLVMSALRHDPSQARGIPGALAELAQHPYGGLLVGVVALGVMAFGLYSLIEARFIRLHEPDPGQQGSALRPLTRR